MTDPIRILVKRWGRPVSQERLKHSIVISGFQFSSVVQSCPTLCNPMDCSMPGFPVHHQLLELAQTHVHRVGDAIQHLIFCCPLLPSVVPGIRVFASESVLCLRWPKFWNFSISLSNEYSELISFRINWFDLLAVQGTLESSPALQFKRINSLALTFLYGPTLTSIQNMKILLTFFFWKASFYMFSFDSVISGIKICWWYLFISEIVSGNKMCILLNSQTFCLEPYTRCG